MVQCCKMGVQPSYSFHQGPFALLRELLQQRGHTGEIYLLRR
ncbi:hypothetical protein MUK42_35836 [Musa troglodytarum]|uniref:Uncharacterized protein n=1 Tax=Musa troglodytarum TaxID=320322 RepID=A0A9E7EEU5_9LILI|nr:hypothetical protein MUK42_35836 [Musa troglodytarum]